MDELPGQISIYDVLAALEAERANISLKGIRVELMAKLLVERGYTPTEALRVAEAAIYGRES